MRRVLKQLVENLLEARGIYGGQQIREALGSSRALGDGAVLVDLLDQPVQDVLHLLLAHLVAQHSNAVGRNRTHVGQRVHETLLQRRKQLRKVRHHVALVCERTYVAHNQRSLLLRIGGAIAESTHQNRHN